MCAEAAAPTQLAVASCERPSQCPANLNLVRPPSPAVPRAVPAPPWPSCTTGGTARWETCQTWPPCRPSRWGWAPHAGLPAAEVERILWAAEAWHGAGRPAKRAGLPGARAACGPQAQMQASVGLAGLPACPLVSQPKAAAACRPPASTLSPPLRPPPAPPPPPGGQPRVCAHLPAHRRAGLQWAGRVVPPALLLPGACLGGAPGRSRLVPSARRPSSRSQRPAASQQHVLPFMRRRRRPPPPHHHHRRPDCPALPTHHLHEHRTWARRRCWCLCSSTCGCWATPPTKSQSSPPTTDKRRCCGTCLSGAARATPRLAGPPRCAWAGARQAGARMRGGAVPACLPACPPAAPVVPSLLHVSC